MAELQQQHPTGGLKNLLPEKGPSTSQVIAIITLLPIGGLLLTISGITLTGSIIGLALVTPLFIIFSPVLVPAAIVLGLAITGFIASGAFGVTGLSSLSWTFNYVRGARQKHPEHLDQAKRRMQEAAGQVGQRTRDVGQAVQSKS